jgi:hypothetical protein
VTILLILILTASIDPVSARDCAEVFGDDADVRANPDAFYRISVDDSLGQDGMILAVLRRGLLIELDGDLFHVLSDGKTAPDVRLTWSSRFGIRERATPSKPSPVPRRRK